MAINHRPKVGEILECHFGHWDVNENFDGHIPPEMRKRRMVVVLNGNLDGKSSIVIPISSSESNNPDNKETTDLLKSVKYHHHLENHLFRVTDFYDKRDRWALCERVTVVSNKRLFYIIDNNTKISQHLPHDIVSEIQKKVIIAISAKSFLENEKS